MREVLFEEAVTVSFSVPPLPVVMPVRSTVCSPAFSLMVTFEGVLIVGGMLT